MRVLVCGGRTYNDKWRIEMELSTLVQDGVPVTIVNGGARGADSIAEQIAVELGFQTETHYADWNRDGRSAGPKRNQAMLDTGIDLVIAFPGGPGTQDMVRRAKKAKVPVREIEQDKVPPILHPGKSTWMWDVDEHWWPEGRHIPCCSFVVGTGRCLNGPLTGEQIVKGDCGRHE